VLHEKVTFVTDEDIEKKILSYLEQYPDVGGTLTDLTDYWIKLQIVEEMAESVRRVVIKLVEDGTLVARYAHDGVIRFYKVTKNLKIEQ